MTRGEPSQESWEAVLARRDWRRAVAAVLAQAEQDRLFVEARAAGEASLAGGNAVEAERHFLHALARQPFHRDCTGKLAAALLAQQRYGVAGQSAHDALALGDLSKQSFQRLATIARRMGKPSPDRAIASARAYWTDGDGAAPGTAPLLAREVQALARIVLGYELPGDDAYAIQHEGGDAHAVAKRLVRNRSFGSMNTELLAMLVETGHA